MVPHALQDALLGVGAISTRTTGDRGGHDQ